MAVPDGRKMYRTLARSLRVQSLLSVLLAGGLLLVSPVAAYSSLFGSLAAFIPAVFFASIVARKFGPDSAAFLRTAVMAEAGKILLTVLICAAAFVWVRPLAAGWFFAGMILVMISGWLSLARWG